VIKARSFEISGKNWAFMVDFWSFWNDSFVFIREALLLCRFALCEAFKARVFERVCGFSLSKKIKFYQIWRIYVLLI